MSQTKPAVSVIIAAYNVERYIKATLQSLDEQTSGLDQLEIVIVNDGSHDDTLQFANAWAADKSNVVVIDKANGGAASARKVGIEVASGTWITSVDPDDILDPKYFQAIFDFLALEGSENASMLVTRVLSLNDSTGKITDNHPLRFRFKHGTRIVSLIDEPDMIQLGATALIRREVLEQNNLNFDTRIEPTFEDAHLLGRYLSMFEEPLVGLIPRAKYYYRKRSDSSSLVQSSWSKNERFTTVLRYGYLDLLEQVHWTYGYVPTWTQNMVLYDIFWYLKEDSGQFSRAAWIDDDLRDEFFGLLKEIFRFINIGTIERFWINPIWWTLRQVVIAYFKTPETDIIPFMWSSSSRNNRSNFTIIRRTTNSEPIQYWHDGRELNPVNTNHVVHTFFGVPMMTEVSFSLEAGPGKFTFVSNGKRYTPKKPISKVLAPSTNHSKISLSWQPSSQTKEFERFPLLRKIKYLNKVIHIRSLATGTNKPTLILVGFKSLISKRIESIRRERIGKRYNRLVEMAHNEYNTKKFREAWCIMDRPDKADDNGEHLYRYLRANRPDINIFFILRIDSPDWNRLSNEGFKLLEPESDELAMAIINAKFRISSDAVAACMYPVPRKFVHSGRSKFVFLQHGVLMNDLSRWLNPKAISAIVASSKDEVNALSGEKSVYIYRKEQVLPTGLARYDTLLEKREGLLPLQQNRIIVMPTWRQHIRDTASKLGSEAERRAYLAGTQFFTEWMQILHSTKLRRLCEEYGSIVTFIPHPALRSLISSIDFPTHVQVADTTKNSIQDLLAEARLFVTDYSSVTFDACYISCPTIYFQFDKSEVFSGRHNFRPGYFDYDLHGFGPVVVKSEDTVSAIQGYLDGTFDDEGYQRRRNETFMNVDQNNRERIVKSISKIQ